MLSDQYLAGLFDGEGTLHIGRRYGAANRLGREVGRIGRHQPEKAAFVEQRRTLMLLAREQMMALNQGRVPFQA